MATSIRRNRCSLRPRNSGRRWSVCAPDSPKSRVFVKRIIVEGDLVAVFVNILLEPGTKGLVVTYILWMQDEKIAQQREVVQEVPATSAHL